jgi:hypothetical protein
MEETKIPPDLRFIKQLKLDQDIFSDFRELRTDLKKHGFDDNSVVSVSSAPQEVWDAYLKFQNSLGRVVNLLLDYGIIEYHHFTALSFEAKEHIKQGMEQIEKEIPLKEI